LADILLQMSSHAVGVVLSVKLRTSRPSWITQCPVARTSNDNNKNTKYQLKISKQQILLHLGDVKSI